MNSSIIIAEVVNPLPKLSEYRPPEPRPLQFGIRSLLVLTGSISMLFALLRLIGVDAAMFLSGFAIFTTVAVAAILCVELIRCDGGWERIGQKHARRRTRRVIRKGVCPPATGKSGFLS